MVTESTYEAIKKADIFGFRKEFFQASLKYLEKTTTDPSDSKFFDELQYIHTELMKVDAYI